jgi:2-keto-3-deoxy-L-rhamnonate aldolase RhmA
MDHPVVIAAIERVIENAGQIGKPCGMPVGSLKDAQFWQERGCSVFLYSEATIMVRECVQRFIREF